MNFDYEKLTSIKDILETVNPYDDNFNPYNNLSNEYDRFAEAYNETIKIIESLMSEKESEVTKLVENNHRYWNTTADGSYFSADRVDSSDGHYFSTIDELVKWEKGYITYFNRGANLIDLYNELNDLQKNSIRLLSCMNCVDGILNDDFNDRLEAAKDISYYAYNIWIDSTRDDLSCEDIAFNIANAINNKITTLDELINNFSLNEVCDLCDNHFENIDDLRGMVKNESVK